jgi:hypothetical protein
MQYGRTRRKGNDTIKMVLGEMRCEGVVYLDFISSELRSFVDFCEQIMNFRVL